MGTVTSVRGEFHRYKELAEKAIEQLDDAALSAAAPGGGNSIATICWHVSGNLRSRFTDFLTTDGEKPWRQRDEEFEPRGVTRQELLDKWNAGWPVLLRALEDLNDGELDRSVSIRGQALTVRDALLRALAHVSYHVGQIVYAARATRGASWNYLSIPPGQSEQYNRDLRK
jgi:uncharacterized damage-inducible protein DinB